MKAVVAAFNQEKALVGAFSVITNLRMDFFEALVLTLTLWHAATPRAPSRQFLWRAAGWRVTPAHVSCFYTPVTNTRCSRGSWDTSQWLHQSSKTLSLSLHLQMSSDSKHFFHFNCWYDEDKSKSRTFTLWEAHSSVHSQQYEAKIKHFVITNILYTLRGRHTSHISSSTSKPRVNFANQDQATPHVSWGRKNKINFVELEIRLAPWQSSHLRITLHWV